MMGIRQDIHLTGEFCMINVDIVTKAITSLSEADPTNAVLVVVFTALLFGLAALAVVWKVLP